MGRLVGVLFFIGFCQGLAYNLNGQKVDGYGVVCVFILSALIAAGASKGDKK